MPKEVRDAAQAAVHRGRRVQVREADEVARPRLPRIDAPTLEVLVEWYSVVRQCIEDRQDASGQVAYANEMGDIRQLPQISTMKTASAEIRALNKQLGIYATDTRRHSVTGAECSRTRDDPFGEAPRGRSTSACSTRRDDPRSRGRGCNSMAVSFREALKIAQNK